jgi:hypothetical protein
MLELQILGSHVDDMKGNEFNQQKSTKWEEGDKLILEGHESLWSEQSVTKHSETQEHMECKTLRTSKEELIQKL